MNQAQQRFLNNRLDEARRAKPSHYESIKAPRPAHIVKAYADKKKAEETIKAWETVQCLKRNKRNAAIDKEFNAAKTKILFATTEEAIKEIERFEDMRFK